MGPHLWMWLPIYRIVDYSHSVGKKMLKPQILWIVYKISPQHEWKICWIPNTKTLKRRPKGSMYLLCVVLSSWCLYSNVNIFSNTDSQLVCPTRLSLKSAVNVWYYTGYHQNIFLHHHLALVLNLWLLKNGWKQWSSYWK